MRLTKIGMQFIPGVTTFREETTYDYTQGGHTLTLCVSNPGREDVFAVQKREAAFGLMVREETLFVLAKFGWLPWSASYYNWWINAPILRPDPWSDLNTLYGGISLSVCLVNASGGILQALRRLTLSNEFSRAFLEMVSTQAEQPFDPWRHAEIVEAVMDDVSAGRDIMKEVFCLCTAVSGNVDSFHENNRLFDISSSDMVGTA